MPQAPERASARERTVSVTSAEGVLSPAQAGSQRNGSHFPTPEGVGYGSYAAYGDEIMGRCKVRA